MGSVLHAGVVLTAAVRLGRHAAVMPQVVLTHDDVIGHAVTFAELGEEDFTGIGISCGGGMFNICVAYKSMPALYFSTARSGDWVDKNVANVLGIKPAKAAL